MAGANPPRPARLLTAAGRRRTAGPFSAGGRSAIVGKTAMGRLPMRDDISPYPAARPLGSLSSPPAAPVTALRLTGDLTLPGRFAITCDDGPVAAVTPVMLAMLARYGIKATFFVVGQRVDACPALVRQVVAEGHALGCHTYDHVDVRTMTKPDILAQLARNQQAVDAALGRPYPLRQFRPPYGETSEDLDEVLTAAKVHRVMWQVNANDGQAPAASVPVLQADIGGNGHLADWSGILLAHDAYPQSPNVVEAFIRHALGRGLQPVTTGQVIAELQGQA
jgi:peptidoglycan/xylan/chitin deacetylase (PgdA/CDA1 family)